MTRPLSSDTPTCILKCEPIDDRRMNNLRQQLQQLSSSSSNDRSKNVKSSSSKLNNQETSNSGGIFCRIEAQFRAQRMAANGIAVKQSG